MARINRIKLHIILIVILALLGAYVFFYPIQDTRTIQGIRKSKIFNFAPGDIEELEVKTKKKIFLCKKVGGQWRIEKPFKALADAKKIIGLLHVFEYGVIEIIEKKASDITQYGLDKPEISLRLKVKSKPESYDVTFGNDNPVGNACYARVKGEKKVLLVGKAYKRDISMIVGAITKLKTGNLKPDNTSNN